VGKTQNQPFQLFLCEIGLTEVGEGECCGYWAHCDEKTFPKVTKQERRTMEPFSSSKGNSSVERLGQRWVAGQCSSSSVVTSKAR
jgi:hypothetical protein